MRVNGFRFLAGIGENSGIDQTDSRIFERFTTMPVVPVDFSHERNSCRLNAGAQIEDSHRKVTPFPYCHSKTVLSRESTIVIRWTIPVRAPTLVESDLAFLTAASASTLSSSQK